MLFSRYVTSSSLQPNGLHRTRLLCPGLLKFTSIESVMLSTHLVLWSSLLLLFSVFPSIRVFSSESILHIRWPKYWSFSFSISPSNEYSRLISFRIDWFDLLAGQRIFKSLLQHHNLKASILWCSWEPTPVFLPGKLHGQRSLSGYSLWGHKELTKNEQLSTAFFMGQLSHLHITSQLQCRKRDFPVWFIESFVSQPLNHGTFWEFGDHLPWKIIC